MEKMTKREFLDRVAETTTDEEVMAFALDEMRKMDARNAKAKTKVTPAKKLQMFLQTMILKYTSVKAETCSEMLARLQTIDETDVFKDVSPQRLSAQLRQLEKLGFYSSTLNKKKVKEYFTTDEQKEEIYAFIQKVVKAEAEVSKSKEEVETEEVEAEEVETEEVEAE